MFNLTPQERRVILFLLGLALAGAGVNFAVKANAKSRVIPFFTLAIGKIDLNQAGKEALMEAPGIGEKLAERIIAYRGRQGNFRGIEDLKNITGMKGSRYEKLKDYFVVR